MYERGDFGNQTQHYLLSESECNGRGLGGLPTTMPGTDLKIFRATAQLNDADALERLLSVIPDNGEIAQQVNTLECGWGGSVDEISRIAHYVVIDGHAVTRFTVMGVSVDEAKAISREFGVLQNWTDQAFHDMVVRVLGEAITRLQ
jgi:hypothetical protein